MARSGEDAKVVSANRLDTGAVVWLGNGDDWVARVEDAVVVSGAAAESALARARQSVEAGVVVDPYLVEVEVAAGSGLAQPLRPRERIRARGPSVRPDLGIQAGTVG
jgi:sulfite reductase (NADPH) hemoprotein beta-component